MTVIGGPSSRSDDITFFVGLEREVWTALAAGDADADRGCLAENFVGVYPSGFGDRAAHAAQLADGPTVADYEIVGPRILRIDADHVMLMYRAGYRRPGSETTEQMYVSSLWSNVDDVWRNVFSQDTPIGGADSVV